MQLDKLEGVRSSAMKTLFLIRHAKSSWADPALPDKDRPLGNRGMRDARKWVSD
jgi:phosphohistidine phosphatase